MIYLIFFKAWCPAILVQNQSSALKNNTAVLSQTRYSEVNMFYTTKIGDYNLENSFPCCSNCNRNSLVCLTYKLEDILKNAKNNYQDYEEMAKTERK